ncbi:hypothetical protein BATDEDRAFT_84659 [Batrachochytrium dendrobatidis JAM81]|uniref:UBR-type domain-containing protein n=2 Tax=Batrachochytrium dendrobatidis TaxID=109871 RepID=F4NTQ9_BATDJ|nr:uncharacterized protein BATDEDRAFT_84659 [Batrachochytrium dendrobatidis JAM81]EGF83126.1 hypothetical protein BATDEDRAFT_84659 [Batrachochytrium dendrobatidis JAM81]OAJ36245.1 hypothetical protein BDEG_20439 [Batrachochytrium dendrobatidis JEL423]|eukprot:XP_006675989.1 hypothetical protein BATDEDRAFT_84659 [Batrachochytrium dendrobatidis JAM81]
MDQLAAVENNDSVLHDTITATEYLEQQEELEKDAAEALPYDFSVCSYSRGYVLQKVYSCKTCAVDAGQFVGVCYGCFVSCHTTHEVVELFQRRHFRCDCGTKCIKGTPCMLDPPGLQQEKSIQSNVENRYNRNFDGVFCVCLEPYNPEVETRTMFQCVICEDWFHDECVSKVPDEDAFEEFLCKACVVKHPFLQRYMHDPKMFCQVESDKTKTVDDSTPTFNENGKRKLAMPATQVDVLTDLSKVEEDVNVESDSIQNCIMLPIKLECVPTHLFALTNWHERLCHCTDCMDMYEREQLSFLFETLEEFTTEKDSDAGRSLLDVGMERLGQIDCVKAINGVHIYNKFKDNLMAYLREFGERGQVVTKKDVEIFFQKQQEIQHAKKRARI